MIKPKMTARVWMGLIGALVALFVAVVIPAMAVDGPENDGLGETGFVSGEADAGGATADRDVTGTETKQKIDEVVRWLFLIAAASGVLTVLYAWHTSPRRRVRLAGGAGTHIGVGATDGRADGDVGSFTGRADADAGSVKSYADPDADGVEGRADVDPDADGVEGRADVDPDADGVEGRADVPVSVMADTAPPTVAVRDTDALPSSERGDRVRPRPPVAVTTMSGQDVGDKSQRRSSKRVVRRDDDASRPNPRPSKPDDSRSPGSA